MAPATWTKAARHRPTTHMPAGRVAHLRAYREPPFARSHTAGRSGGELASLSRPPTHVPDWPGELAHTPVE